MIGIDEFEVSLNGSDPFVLKFLTPLPTVPSSLLSSLVSYWTFSEASGTRADSLGINNLSLSSGSPGSVPGKIGAATVIPGTGFDAIGCAPLNPPNSFTFAGWLNFSSINDTSSNLVVFGQQISQLEFWLVQRDSSLQMRVSSDNETVVSAPAGVTLSVGNWYFVVIQYDNVGHTLSIGINDGALASVPFSGPLFSGTDNFYFGWSVGTPASFSCNQWGYWGRVLTSSELSLLYGGGNGLAYPF